MRSFAATVAIAFYFCTVFVAPGHAEDLAGKVKKAIDKSTLDQPGTRPFHLKAVYAPSFERDKESHREGEVEIWWESPTRWRREVRSPEFHQIAIVDGARQWQKNEGDYFPEWLRELAVAIDLQAEAGARLGDEIEDEALALPAGDVLRRAAHPAD